MTQHTVLLYSDDPEVRDRMRMAIGGRPAADLSVKFVDASTYAEVVKLVGYSISPFYAGGKIIAQNTAELKEMYSGLVVESGRMKDWKLLTPSEAGVQGAPESTFVLQIRTAKEAFSVILTRTKSGEYRATQLAR